MTINAFPPVESADRTGLLAIGGDLDRDSLLLAYRSGIFPWPVDDVLAWFAPPQRAILDFQSLHISRSLQKLLRRHHFKFSFNHDFVEVITACADVAVRRKKSGTWITPELQDAYIRLFQQQYAWSAECWLDNELAGGIYGVVINGFLSGESMFHRETNASKAVLCYAVDQLSQRGFSWFDCQILTPHLESLGAIEITRRKYMKKLEAALDRPGGGPLPIIRPHVWG